MVHRSVSLPDAKTICILFDASDENNIEVVKNFTRQLELQHKKVESVGYLPKEKKGITRRTFIKGSGAGASATPGRR